MTVTKEYWWEEVNVVGIENHLAVEVCIQKFERRQYLSKILKVF